ncbi:lantibiotic dehydratase [Nonomuraea sp. NPDC050536]|uniref:lantibiotic dehydratase n=1 Tax=Nonomuraea sp. NPDC050536 TaxID=3364366 RepID=UPI0037CC08B4
MRGVPGRISGPVLARVAGLPADVLDLVGMPTRDLLDELARCREELERLAPALVDALFELVPLLDDDVPLRRRVLAGKRAVNRLAPLPWDDDVVARVRARLPGGLVEEWIRLTAGGAELTAKLATHLAADRSAALEALRSCLDDPGFARSLALTAPDWIRYGKRDTPRDRQTLYSYVSRAAVKTSPMSGLTTVGLAGAAGRGRARSRTAATPAYRELWRLAHAEETAAGLRYRPGHLAGDLFLHSAVQEVDGIVWRQDSVVEADHARPWLARLPGAELTLTEILDAVGGERPFARFLRLLDTGVLHPIPPWGRGQEPFAALGLPRTGQVGADARDGDVPARLAAVAEVGLIYEDRETVLDLPDPFALPPVRDDLAELTARMRPWIFRSHVYDLLVERFVAEYGEGGTCPDPLGFLMRLSPEGDSNGPLDQAVAQDLRARADPGRRAWLPVGPTSAPPAAALLLQLEAEDQAAVAAGDYRMVVNNFSYGSGGLFTRFRGLLGDDLRERLAAHLAACWPEVSRRELVVWTECNTVQAECAGLLQPLVLPGELDGPGGVCLGATTLAHDAGTGTLSLLDASGEPVGLAYLGLIPQHLLQSYVRLLAVLADPWINAAPYSDYTMIKAYELQAHCGPDVVALPRQSVGRVVTRRASWIVPVDRLPLPVRGQAEAEPALSADRFRRAHGLPEEVFVHQLGSTTLSMGGERKPLWVSLASPLSLGALAQWLRPETRHVRVVEALPSRDRHPQLDADGRRRATEHAVLVRWPRQGG